jgi:trimethylamine--corrinoid protein Co-methyltransferase
VLVNEILYMVNQFMSGVPVNDETLALDMMNRVGPGGHYLNEDHTLRHYKEMWYSDLFDRSIYQTWLARGAKTFDERLRNKTTKLLKHQPKPLPEEVARELEVMAQHWQ